MAAVYACLHEDRVKKLVLLAPALHLDECQPFLTRKLRIPVVIYHGRQDEVVPMEAVRTIAGQFFKSHQFNIVEDDHSLHGTFENYDWDALLTP